MLRRFMTVLTFAVAWTVSATQAQQADQANAIVTSDVASRISAFNYREGPKSKLLMVGTPLAPTAKGKASVEFQDGRSIVKTEIKKLPDPASLGPYTTYVLWAIAPDGRATNIGSVGTSRGKGELKTSYSGSQFALVIAAEPHYAVSIPGTAVVLYNVGDKIKGVESKVASLVERANYATLQPIAVNTKTAPVELVGARYALAIAAAAGAEKYAAPAYGAAKTKLQAAEAAQASGRSADRKQAPLLAREATQAGEDARRAGMSAKAAVDEEQRRSVAAAAAAEAQREQSAEIAAEAAAVDLRKRLSAALPTRESNRGLISEIGGVQFASGTANLTTGARESLARFAGVVASYPDLRYNVEGHTDNAGRTDENRELSLKRAISVRDYLIAQGIPASSIDVRGLGASAPVCDNATPNGRACNRRVEIVVSGGPLAK